MLYEILIKMPKNVAIGSTLAVSLGLSYSFWAYQQYSGEDYGGAYPGEPRTTGAEWQKASEEYKIAHNINPMRRANK